MTSSDDFLKSLAGKVTIPGKTTDAPSLLDEEEMASSTDVDVAAPKHKKEGAPVEEVNTTTLPANPFDADKFFDTTVSEVIETSNPALDEDELDLSYGGNRGAYYSPGEMLEGQRRMEVSTPSGWEREGSAFDIKKGRHEALIESIYSTELDAPVKDKAKTKTTRYLLYGMIGIVAVALIGFLVIAKNQHSNTQENTIQQSSQLLDNPLAKLYPSILNQDGTILVSYGQNQLKANSSVLNLPESPLASSDSCVNGFNPAKDICFVATTKSGPRVYYSLDLVHSDVFSTMISLTPSSVKGAKYSAISEAVYAGNTAKFLLILDQNNSGWAIEMPASMDNQAITSFASSLSLEKSGK